MNDQPTLYVLKEGKNGKTYFGRFDLGDYGQKGVCIDDITDQIGIRKASLVIEDHVTDSTERLIFKNGVANMFQKTNGYYVKLEDLMQRDGAGNPRQTEIENILTRYARTFRDVLTHSKAAPYASTHFGELLKYLPQPK